MIKFNFVRWKNLLSTGNEWTEVRLDNAKTTLIIGANGHGKSTILDAIKLCLYNKPFRKVNKGMMVNSVTNKNCLIEIGFEKGNDKFLVRRGIKPNIFEIIKNTELVDQNAESRDYQAYLEEVLGMNEKAFTQIDILGAASFVPFMQLTVPARREVIEDFMDIQVFSVMNKALLKKISNNNLNAGAAWTELKILMAQLEGAEKANKMFSDDNQTIIDGYLKQIDEYGIVAHELVDKIGATDALKTNFDVSLLDVEDKLIAYKGELETEARMCQAKIADLQKKVDFLTKNDVCPTCKRPHDIIERQNEIRNHEIEIDINIQRGKNAVLENKKVIASLEKLNDNKASIKKLDALIEEYRREIKYYEMEGMKCLDKIEDLKKKKDMIDTTPLKISVASQQKKVDAYDKNAKIYAVASELLKDDGIKAVIINQYIPIVNSLINKYLAEMDFFVDFHLDESFQEKIKSRHRDEFAYESFSEGEKMRIDLAILFAWREVAKQRNSAATNLLMFDEILDSSLDPNGVEEFIRIIKSMSSTENIFVISHRGDAIGDKFDRVLKFTKTSSFSHMEEL